MDILLSEQEIRAAFQRIQPFLTPTPLIYSDYFSRKLNADIFLKLEVLQPTHSFKVRGAFNAILTLSDTQRQKGVITASGGNHGLGIAYAAAKLQTTATVYLPTSTPQNKVDAIKVLGAEVIVQGEAFDHATQHAMAVAREQDRAYIHAFDNAYVMAGQGTIVSELCQQLSDIDRIVVAIGGGGLISGITSAAQAYSPKTQISGVETAGADCMAQSIAAGKIVELPAITSVAESLGAKKTAERQFQIVARYVKPLVVVSDEEAIASLLEILQYEKMLVEPAASCTLAALVTGKIPIKKGERIVAVICGANIALEKVFQWSKKRLCTTPFH